MDVEANGTQFKDTEVLVSEAKEVEAAASNSKTRSAAKYAVRNAVKYEEGHVVGKTPSGTVKPIGFAEGRGALVLKAGRFVGYTAGVGASVLLSGLSGTSAAIDGKNGRVNYQYAADVHLDDGAQAEFDYFAGAGPEPSSLNYEKNKENYSAPIMIGVAWFLMMLGG